MDTPALLGAAAAVLALLLVGWVVWAWTRRTRRQEPAKEEAYTRALTALIAGDPRLALVSLKEAVQENSDNLDAYIRMGDLLRDSGEVQKALAVHRDLTVRTGLSDAARTRILESITRDYLAAKRYEEAGQSAERLLRLDRHNRFALRAVQEVAEALGDWPRAIGAVEQRLKAQGKDDGSELARYRTAVGERELAADNLKLAREHFDKALELDGDCVAAHLHLGDMEQAAGKLEAAVEHWRTYALATPESANLVFERLERAFFELGHFGEVISFYRELVDRTPREAAAPALLALAEIHRRKGDLEEAETFVREALEIDPANLRGHRQWVRLALDREDPQAALARLDRMLASADDHATPID